MKVFFDSQNEKYKAPFGAVCVSSQVRFFIEAEGAAECSMRIWDDEDGELLLPMAKSGEGFSLEFTVPAAGRLLWYHFVLKDDAGSVLYYGNNDSKMGGVGILKYDLPLDYQITVYKRQAVPQWYKDSIVYQIFPDRFARDDAAERRAEKLGIVLEEWGKPPFYQKNKAGDVIRWDFYGGSLRGIKDNLLSLRSLGIGAIYLNPIFKAASNHRYDTADFFKIDPLLGTEEDFVQLCKEAGEYGIRIILDGVFSHVGSKSIYFEEGSKYRNWFKFDDSDLGYKAWWGVKDLPEVNELDQSYVDYICGRNGVIEYWLKKGASGFRLDVADELPDKFIKQVRQAVKRCGEDKVLIGEVWEDASNKESYGEKRRYLMGEELDAVMDYPLRNWAVGFALGEISGIDFQNEFCRLRENYPTENFYASFNLLGSHDRERLLTRVGGVRERVKMLYSLVYALPGVPVVYYGDEVGMTGGTDPENRACMNRTETADLDMRYHFRMLKVIYSEHPVLKDGTYTPVRSGEWDIFAFERSNAKEKILVVANRNTNDSKKFRYRTNCKYALELVKSKEYHGDGENIELVVPPCSTAMFLLREQAPQKLRMDRKAGVLCPLFSIPGGKLGKSARKFIDWLADSGISLWQMLPIHPVGMGNSPYLSPDVFKGDESFIDYDEVVQSQKGADPQVLFATQWKEMLQYAHKKGVSIIGDIPIYIDPKGKDIKKNPDCFQVDGDGKLRVRAGVPPDYFQQDGQDWGNPLYNWDYMKANGYKWWMDRIRMCSSLFDYIRLDHFRSFSEYYAIPYGRTARDGEWLTGPGMDFFNSVKRMFPNAKFIAEDLGLLDDAVFNLIKLSGIPGMNVWQFSAAEMEKMNDGQCSDRIFYSGTHDNQTLLSWCGSKEKCAEILEKLCDSKAPWVIFQLQDLLFLDDSARINVPGTIGENWKWQCPAGLLDRKSAERIKAMVKGSLR